MGGQTRPSKTAFSLMELVAVIVILAVIGAVAAPRYAQSLARYRVDRAAARVAADLGFARQDALLRSTPRTVAFSIVTGTYWLIGLTDLDEPTQPYQVNLADDPYVARIVSASFGGDANVVFDMHGRPDTGGTVTLAVGGWQTTVTVNAHTGKAKVP